MELYISDHPLDCHTCAANGELRDPGDGRRRRPAEVRYGYERRRTTSTQPMDMTNPYFAFDASKCIVCSRCVRACDDIQGTFALTVEGRGFDSAVAPAASRLHRVRVRLLRRLRAGLPDVRARGEDASIETRHARALGR